MEPHGEAHQYACQQERHCSGESTYGSSARTSAFWDAAARALADAAQLWSMQSVAHEIFARLRQSQAPECRNAVCVSFLPGDTTACATERSPIAAVGLSSKPPTSQSIGSPEGWLHPASPANGKIAAMRGPHSTGEWAPMACRRWLHFKRRSKRKDAIGLDREQLTH